MSRKQVIGKFSDKNYRFVGLTTILDKISIKHLLNIWTSIEFSQKDKQLTQDLPQLH